MYNLFVDKIDLKFAACVTWRLLFRLAPSKRSDSDIITNWDTERVKLIDEEDFKFSGFVTLEKR